MVEDGKYYNLMESPAAAVFVPLAQDSGRRGPRRAVVAAADGDRRGTAPARWARVQPNVPITLRTWPEALEGVLYPARAARSRWASWDSSR